MSLYNKPAFPTRAEFAQVLYKARATICVKSTSPKTRRILSYIVATERWRVPIGDGAFAAFIIKVQNQPKQRQRPRAIPIRPVALVD